MFLREGTATHPIQRVIYISQFFLDIKFEHDPVLLSEVKWHEDDGCVSDLAAKPASQVAVLVVGVRLVASAKKTRRIHLPIALATCQQKYCDMNENCVLKGAQPRRM